MDKEALIRFWKIQLENRALLSPSMRTIIESTIKYLEEDNG